MNAAEAPLSGVFWAYLYWPPKHHRVPALCPILPPEMQPSVPPVWDHLREHGPQLGVEDIRRPVEGVQ